MIRAAGPDDQGAVLRLVDRFLATSPYGGIVGGDRPGAAALYTTALDQGAVFIAEVATKAHWAEGKGTEVTETQVVGFIAIIALTHPMSHELMSSELAWFVEPEHRGGRIGPKLLQCAELWALHRGLPVIQMIAPAGSDVGYFYERMGYTAVETTYQKRLQP